MTTTSHPRMNPQSQNTQGRAVSSGPGVQVDFKPPKEPLQEGTGPLKGKGEARRSAERPQGQGLASTGVLPQPLAQVEFSTAGGQDSPQSGLSGQRMQPESGNLAPVSRLSHDYGSAPATAGVPMPPPAWNTQPDASQQPYYPTGDSLPAI